MPMFVPESDWRPPRVGDLPEWPKNASARVAIDVETKDPDLKKMGCGARRDDTMLVGYSFRIEGGPGFYVPIAHQGGDNVENPEGAKAYIAAQARLFKGQLVGCNLHGHLALFDVTAFDAVFNIGEFDTAVANGAATVLVHCGGLFTHFWRDRNAVTQKQTLEAAPIPNDFDFRCDFGKALNEATDGG
jgi:hypothetical protein